MASRRTVKKAAARTAGGIKGAINKVAKVASFVPGPVGIVGSIAGALTGGGSQSSASGKSGTGKKRIFSIARMQKRLIQAKINAKIQKARLSAFKGL